MKIIALLALLALAVILTSCQTPQQTAQLVAIGNRILAYAEQEGKITPQEAALVRDVGKIAVTPDANAAVVLGPVVEVSGK